MSYIAFDLDALNVSRDVGAAAGIPEERVTHGLLRMWAWCFREKTASVTAVHVRGFFGIDCAEALIAFGFLAREDDGFRVRGAERYLRISEARRRGAERTNAAKRKRTPSDDGPSLKRRSSDAQATLDRALPNALTPSTEHRTPNTEHHKDCADAQPPPKAPKAKRAEQPADPRHQPLVRALDEVFRQARGTPYPYKPRDFAAVKSLLAAGTPEVILAAWRKALAHRGYPSVSSPSELHQHLAHFVGTAAAPVDKTPHVVGSWTPEKQTTMTEGF